MNWHPIYRLERGPQFNSILLPGREVGASAPYREREGALQIESIGYIEREFRWRPIYPIYIWDRGPIE